MTTSTASSTSLKEDPALQPPRLSRRQRYQRVVRLSLQLSDLLLINLAFIAAYYLRYIVGVGGDVADENFVDLATYLPLQAGLTLTLFPIYHLSGLYRSP
ncbi:MAG TPA: hypothetical protein VJM51_02230, partial [Dehalococcoidia bacterium]|nr:hypothetical protein [Dehalococcoidia bacterium]